MRAFSRLMVAAWLLSMSSLALPVWAQDAQTPAPAAAPAPEAAKRVPKLAAYYNTLLKELKLEGEAREKFIDAVVAKADGLAAWKKEHADKLAELEKAIEDAKTSGKTADQEAAEKELKALKAEQAKTEAQLDAAILATLTPEQRGIVKAYGAYTGSLLRALTKAGITLTTEEKAQVKAAAYAHAQDFAALADNDKKGATALGKTILAEVVEKVLTAEQKATYEKATKKE